MRRRLSPEQPASRADGSRDSSFGWRDDAEAGYWAPPRAEVPEDRCMGDEAFRGSEGSFNHSVPADGQCEKIAKLQR